MKRAAWINGLLLAVLLFLAWQQWTSEPEVDRGDKVVLLSGDAADITQIRWAGDKSESTLVRQSDALGEYTWVQSTRWTKKPVVAPGPQDGAPVEVAEPERIAKDSVFKASGKIDKLYKDLSPMLALRRLEVTDDAKIAEIGLTEPTATISIVRGSQTQTLDIGGEAYGSKHIYVRRQSDGLVYLVERDLIQTLKNARSRLADHSLVGLARKDIARAVITWSGESLDVTQRNVDDERQARWVLSEDQEQAQEQLTTWMGQALKLKGMRYADPSDPPADLQTRLSVELIPAKGASQTLEILQVGDGGDWYARSAYTRGLVKVVRSGARGLVDDVQSVIESTD